MTRNWLFVRLLEPLTPREAAGSIQRSEESVPEIPPLVHEIVDLLYAEDNEALWYFERLEDHYGPHLALWLRARPEVVQRIGQEIGRTSGTYQQSVVWDHYEPPTAKYLDPGTVELAAALASASSDLALGLRRGEDFKGSGLGVAFLHLAQITELLAPKDRSAFLFQCWQHWTGGLSGRSRAELARRRGPAVETAALQAADLRWNGVACWERYGHTLRTLVAEHSGPAPLGYLLFDHARLTHRRLGVGVADETLAAHALRSALAPDAGLPGHVRELLAGAPLPV
ncbi:lantibiotic dehydratase C-terminal domain-containing protein [Streptomyces sp. NPDC046465]|uniref:lantibiotic dehydratase C-terminal domain-containing protein n=1 Tax=Streptomyces sp. NPDC046465 TaxID=3155810 RepID=UPI0033E0F718